MEIAVQYLVKVTVHIIFARIVATRLSRGECVCHISELSLVPSISVKFHDHDFI